MQTESQDSPVAKWFRRLERAEWWFRLWSRCRNDTSRAHRHVERAFTRWWDVIGEPLPPKPVNLSLPLEQRRKRW